MRIVRLDSVGSTNDEVVARAGAGEALPLAVVAAEQAAGRGRNGRSWSSPVGGVWLSVGVDWPGYAGGAVALRVALAVRAAVAEEAAEAAQVTLGAFDPGRLLIKWPNDLLLDGKKVAGVLCERRVLGDGRSDGCSDGRAVLVVGVGINACFDAEQLPGDVRTPATTLQASVGGGVVVDRLADRAVRAIGGALDRDRPTRLTDAEVESITEVLAYRGERIEIGGGDPVSGVVVGIDADGRVLVRTGAGVQAVVAGDLVGPPVGGGRPPGSG